MQLVCRIWTNSLLDLWVTYVKKEWKYLYIYFLGIRIKYMHYCYYIKGQTEKQCKNPKIH